MLSDVVSNLWKEIWGLVNLSPVFFPTIASLSLSRHVARACVHVRACVRACVCAYVCVCARTRCNHKYLFSLLFYPYSFTFNTPSPTDRRKRIFLQYPSKLIHDTFARALNGIYLNSYIYFMCNVYLTSSFASIEKVDTFPTTYFGEGFQTP